MRGGSKMENVQIKLGKNLHFLIQSGEKKFHFQNHLSGVRKTLIQEYEMFSPLYTLTCDEEIGAYEYAFILEGFGRLVYEAEMWDVKKESDSLFERMVFHYERFLRKWYTNAPDIAIEDKLKSKPFLVEYGEEWADVIETETFYRALQKKTSNFSIRFEEPPFWESDYVKSNQLVVYVYGKDHFVKPLTEKTMENLLNQVIQPILRENQLRIKHY